MDEVDLRLVKALRDDGRASYENLGVAVGLSADAVRDRLRRLTDQGLVRIVGIVDPGAIGLEVTCLAGLEIVGPIEPVAEKLVDVPEIDLVGCVAGSYDMFIELAGRDESHLFATIDRQVRSHPEVRRCTPFVYLDILKYVPGGWGGFDSETFGGVPTHRSLDAADRGVLETLQQDGRASFRDIAEQSGLSYANARRRAHAMLTSGAIRIETIVNRLAEGTAVEAAVGLHTSGSHEKLKAALMAIPQVEVAVSTTGPFDAFISVACSSRGELYDLVGSGLRELPSVVGSETFVFTRILKLPVALTTKG